MDVPRSKLFVPADRLDLVDEALAVKPDALSFDLEDAVAKHVKTQARHMLAARLQGEALPCATWVRVNGCGSGHLVADVLALSGAHVDVVNLPKVEDPAQVHLLEELLTHIEKSANSSRVIHVVPTIETPRGVRHAAAIARASPRVLALQLGAGDLTRRTGMDRLGLGHDLLRTLLALAAAEAGVAALDSTPHGMDERAFEIDARQARTLGLRGKSCMHAAQVAVVNTVFSRSS